MRNKEMVRLTDAERRHLLRLLQDNAEEGSYFGNRTQYWARHWRLVEKLDGYVPASMKAQEAV